MREPFTRAVHNASRLGGGRSRVSARTEPVGLSRCPQTTRRYAIRNLQIPWGFIDDVRAGILDRLVLVGAHTAVAAQQTAMRPAVHIKRFGRDNLSY